MDCRILTSSSIHSSTQLKQRATKSLWMVLDGCDHTFIPVRMHWRLNERHYGALQVRKGWTDWLDGWMDGWLGGGVDKRTTSYQPTWTKTPSQSTNPPTPTFFLKGLSKEESEKRMGPIVREWRRSWRAKPPDMDSAHPHWGVIRWVGGERCVLGVVPIVNTNPYRLAPYTRSCLTTPIQSHYHRPPNTTQTPHSCL